MPSYSHSEIVLVRYPFSNLTGSKVRPAVVVNAPHISHDLLIVPLTSRITGLLPTEFVLHDWQGAGLNVASAVKRGIYTIEKSLIVKTIGSLTSHDRSTLEQSLRDWLGLH
ncbi:MAG: type II toxin-antitoxin system PemK/MazF family toxin [Acidobacteria bacterium]|nr:type II toxin-antitoxin system PemK/MazF family toxin [Acidobacteriota bacterium]MBI3422553.1 type II toxin-antitoxin system PemK/MazF family toxin [Acidobacteriota bacterium]